VPPPLPILVLAAATVLSALAAQGGCAATDRTDADAAGRAPDPVDRSPAAPASSETTDDGSTIAIAALSEPTAIAADPVAAIEYEVLPWRFGDWSGREVRTAHYAIHSTMPREEDSIGIARFYDAALARYRTAFGPLPAPSRLMRTYFFADRDQWLAKTEDLLPGQIEDFRRLGRGGYATAGTSVIYDIDRWGLRDTLAIAAHEGWHQYTQSTFRQPLPTWLEEGIATYMEGHVVLDDGAVRFVPEDNEERLRTLRRAVDEDLLLPMDALLHRSPHRLLRESRDDLLIYYAQTWALVRYLQEGEGGRLRAGLHAMIRDAAEGHYVDRLRERTGRGHRRGLWRWARTGPAAIEAYLTTDLMAFERRYARFVRSLVGR